MRRPLALMLVITTAVAVATVVGVGDRSALFLDDEESAPLVTLVPSPTPYDARERRLRSELPDALIRAVDQVSDGDVRLTVAARDTFLSIQRDPSTGESVGEIWGTHGQVRDTVAEAMFVLRVSSGVGVPNEATWDCGASAVVCEHLERPNGAVVDRHELTSMTDETPTVVREVAVTRDDVTVRVLLQGGQTLPLSMEQLEQIALSDDLAQAP